MAKKEKKAVFAEGISKSDVTGVASTKNNNENRLMLKYMLFLSILSFCVYANTLPNGYAYDDEAAITTNVIVKKGISAIPELLSTPYHRGTYIEYSNKQATDNLYRPLSLIMFAVEYQIAGNTPAVGHFVNIVLYAGCVALLFLFVYRLFKKRQLFIAFIAALLFALHPIHTEVVANIKSRDELLCFFFGFLALNTFTKYIDTQRAGSLIRGLVFYFLSLLSKETSITFLAVIPFVFFFYRNEDRKRSVHIFLLSLLPAALYFSIRYSVLSAFYDSHATGVPFLDNMLTGAPSLASRLATAMLIQGNYLKLLFVPYPLICDYSYNAIPIVNFGNIWVLLTIIVYGAILFFGIYRLINKRFDPLTFGIFFFLITLSIFSNVLFLIGSDMGERFLFFPSAGFCIAVAFIMEQIVFRQATGEIPPVKDKKILFMLIPVGIIFIAITMNRNTEWKDSFTLFLADSKTAPNNCRILYFAANAEMAKVREEGTDTATKNDMLSDAIGCSPS